MLNITWEDWVHKYFYRGKTVGVYLLIFMVIFSLYEVFVNRGNILAFIFSLVMLITSYAVFTDLIAHLWSDDYEKDITMDEYIQKILHLRTHDIYGLMIYAIMVFALFIMGAVFWAISSVFLAFALVVIEELIQTKFYH